MKRTQKVLNANVAVILIMTLALMMLSGCTKAVNGLDDYSVPVNEISVPDNARIVALGEATHGNVEFQQLKLDVFRTLVEKSGIRVFALEDSVYQIRIVL